MNMEIVILFFALITFFSVTYGKFNYFSDISDNEYKKFQDIENYLKKRIDGIESSEIVSTKKILNELFLNTVKPNYEFSLGKTMSAKDDSSLFGFGPSDPRFYQDLDRQDLEGNNEPLFEGYNKLKPDKVISLNNKASQFKNRIMTETEVEQIPITSSYGNDETDIYFIGVVAGCSAAAIFITTVIGISCYRLRKRAKATADVEYPAYGITGPNRAISTIWSDHKLAQSIQMYHYQHQKQQIIAMESMHNKEGHCSLSDAESEENEEGDYTVYECPGLASTGEMEVKNPMFVNDQTLNQVKEEKESAEGFQYFDDGKSKNLS